MADSCEGSKVTTAIPRSDGPDGKWISVCGLMELGKRVLHATGCKESSNDREVNLRNDILLRGEPCEGCMQSCNEGKSKVENRPGPLGNKTLN